MTQEDIKLMARECSAQGTQWRSTKDKFLQGEFDTHIAMRAATAAITRMLLEGHCGEGIESTVDPRLIELREMFANRPQNNYRADSIRNGEMDDALTPMLDRM